MPIRPRQCLNEDCDGRVDGEGRKFDLFCRDGLKRFFDMDAEVLNEEHEACGVCGSTDLRKLVSNARAIWTRREAGHGKIYPFDDTNLGMRIHSKAHHDRVMKERGLVHITVQDARDEGLRLRNEDRKTVEDGEMYDREVEESPEYAEFRALRAKGAFIPDHVPAAKRDKALAYQMKNEVR